MKRRIYVKHSNISGKCDRMFYDLGFNVCPYTHPSSMCPVISKEGDCGNCPFLNNNPGDEITITVLEDETTPKRRANNHGGKDQ